MDTNEGQPPSDPAWGERVRKATPVVYGEVELGRVEEISCESWSDFCERVRFSDSPFTGRMFRGLSDTAWELQSKWDRYEKQKPNMPAGHVPIRGMRDTPETFLERNDTSRP